MSQPSARISTLTVMAAENGWFKVRFPRVARADCISLAPELPWPSCGAGPAGRVEPALTGMAALVDTAYELHDRAPGRQALIVLTTIGF